ncbi:MAG TPA: hypothetical protein VNO21_07845, partial [Polyangiaceae bacterium]|nr:hypothetical protein [Polyangiaceae bacterium]
MNDDAARRWHGIGLPYHRAHDGARADRLRALAELPLRLDRAGVETAWGIVRDPMQTVISGVKKLGTADGLALRIGETAFEEQVERIARTADAPALALGGGVDATAVLR